jgi:hypothetical protein
MDCTTAEERLAAHRHGELDERERAAMDAHLAGCGPCRELALTDARIAELYSLATVSRARAGFTAAVMEEVGARQARRTLVQAEAEHLRWRRRVVTVALSVAAHAAVLLVLVALRPEKRPQSSMPEVALYAHLAEIVPSEGASLLWSSGSGRGGDSLSLELDFPELPEDTIDDEPRPGEDDDPGRGIVLEPEGGEPTLPALEGDLWRRLPIHDSARPAATCKSFEQRGSRESRRESVARTLGGYAALGTVDDAISAGLGFLARTQDEEGAWSAAQGGGDPELSIAVTGLATLPFLAEGHHSSGTSAYCREVVLPAIEALERAQASDGAIGARIGQRGMFNHGIATVALAENLALAAIAGDQTEVARRRRAVQRAIGFLLHAQSVRESRGVMGGWGYRPGSRVADTSVTGWQVQALAAYESAMVLSGRRSSSTVDRLFRGVREWLDEFTDPLTGKVGYDGFRQYGTYGPTTLTAIGLLAGVSAGRDPGSELCRSQQRYLAGVEAGLDIADGEVDLCRAYFIVSALQLAAPGSAELRGWYRRAMPELVRLQVGVEEGDQRGSWPVIDRWSRFGGSTYTTATALLLLQTPYRLAR